MKSIYKLKNYKLIRSIYSLSMLLKQFVKFKPLLLLKQLIWYSNQYLNFKKHQANQHFKTFELQPCLFDNTLTTPLDPTYFYQDSWAAKKIFELNVNHHYDVGSSAKTIAILSQFVPITMVDIRPIELRLNNLFFQEGSILNLPFEDNSIDSISSLCVVEHIGLGRYGDTLDTHGSEKGIGELKRVVKHSGTILISVPVDYENKVYFNAHRAFSRDYVLSLFSGFELLEEKYQYGNNLYNTYDPEKGFGTGLYMFKKL